MARTSVTISGVNRSSQFRNFEFVGIPIGNRTDKGSKFRKSSDIAYCKDLLRKSCDLFDALYDVNCAYPPYSLFLRHLFPLHAGSLTSVDLWGLRALFRLLEVGPWIRICYPCSAPRGQDKVTELDCRRVIVKTSGGGSNGGGPPPGGGPLPDRAPPLRKSCVRAWVSYWWERNSIPDARAGC